MGQTYALPSDVWSTGITFVEVEQGHPPFQIETEFKLVREIFQTVGGRFKNLELCTKLVKQSARKWGETYGGEFQALVDSMLVFDPDDRISSRVAARRSLAWWSCSQPLAGSVQPSSASQHTQPLAGPPLAGSVQPSSASQHSQPLAGPLTPLSHHSGYHSGVQPGR